MQTKHDLRAAGQTQLSSPRHKRPRHYTATLASTLPAHRLQRSGTWENPCWCVLGPQRAMPSLIPANTACACVQHTTRPHRPDSLCHRRISVRSRYVVEPWRGCAPHRVAAEVAANPMLAMPLMALVLGRLTANITGFGSHASTDSSSQFMSQISSNACV